MEIELSEERVDLPDNFMETAPRVNLSRRAIITGLAAGTVFPIVSGCTTNPETGRTQIAFMGDTQIAEMASSAWTDLKSQTPQTSDTRLKTVCLVSGTGYRMARRLQACLDAGGMKNSGTSQFLTKTL